MDNYYIFLISKWTLALILIIAGIRKTLDFRAKKSSASQTAFVRLLTKTSSSRSIIILELVLGLAVLYTHNLTFLIVTSFCLFLLNGFIRLLSLFYKGFSCNCFGNQSNDSWLIKGIIFLTLLSITIVFFYTPDDLVRNTILELAVSSLLLLLSFLYFIKRLKIKKTATLGENSENFLPHTISDRVIGISNGTRVKLSDYIHSNNPLFVVGVNSNCNECKSLLPDLVGFSKGFGEEITFVLVTDSISYTQHMEDPNLNIVLDEKHLFLNSLQGAAMPYALLLHSDKLEQKAPLTFGASSIRYLFTAILNAKN